MTTKTADEIVVGANGTLYVALVGSAIPATIADPLDADWIDLGFASEDGVAWTDGKTIKPLRGWQSFYDLRRIITAREGMLKYGLIQWSGDNFRLAFGGGTITESAPGSGLYEYTPPDPEEIDERAQAIEWQDGAKNYRLIFPKGMVTENVETTIARTDMAMLPITFSLLGEDGVEPFRLQTDDPAFADAVGS